MPALTKKDILEYFPQGLLPSSQDVSRGLASGEIQFVKTSGSTGDSVTNIWNQRWWDASERASWKLNSYAAEVATGCHREAILANPLNVGFVSDEIDLPMEKRRLSRFLFLNERTNPLSWTNEYMDRIIRELDVFKPVVLEANPSLLAKLCRYIVTYKKMVFQPELIVFTYEYPTNLHHQQIHRVFDVPIASSYGSTEVGYVFMQCEEGKFHQNSEFCRVDFQPFKPEHGGPTLGRILVTTFNNPWYIIVRFDVGDIVRLDREGVCWCGRESGQILSAIEGRTGNVTLTCKGRVVTLRELDNAISILEDIDEYQLYQVSRDDYHLHLVSQRTDKNMLQNEAKKILSELYGEEARISIIFEGAIAPLASGKYSMSRTLFPLNIEDFLDDRCICKTRTT
jgi:phenylacetate-coenzyme A ligase PaaK-like adenylate-forming protein